MTTRLLGAVNVGYRFGMDQLAISRKRHSPAHDRPSFACPWCGRSARFVYAVTGRWACSLCHDLVSVQRLLGPVTKYQRRLAELHVLIKRGRPHYGRQARFDQQAAEYGRLLAEFSHAPPLPRELGFAQYAEWLHPDDPRLKQQVEDGEEGYGWTRYDEGGFKRLTWLGEQEHKRHGEAEFASRGKGAASAVKPLAAKQQGRTSPPFAPGEAPGSAAPRPFRFDPAALDMQASGAADEEAETWAERDWPR